MRAFEFLTEYGSRKGVRHKKYRDGGTPVDWFDKAVQLKKDNPRMSAVEISKRVGVSHILVLRWLAGLPDSNSGNIYNDNPPFTQKDFSVHQRKKYFDGAKPWWYEEAIELRKQGMMYKDIANKLSTPERKILGDSIRNWLTKGRKYRSGNLINKDAPFEPTLYGKKIDTALIKELIVDGKDDADIIKPNSSTC